MKNECGTYDFDSSGSAASRINCRTGMMPFGPHSFAPQPASLPLENYQYRNNSLPTYPYPVKSFYPMSYGDFSDDPVDYGLQSSLMGNDHLGLSSNYITASSSGRGWTPAPAQAPPMPKTPLFIEQSDTPYSHNQLPYHAYPLRGNMNSDSKNGSMNGMSATLPPPPVSIACSLRFHHLRTIVWHKLVHSFDHLMVSHRRQQCNHNPNRSHPKTTALLGATRTTTVTRYPTALPCR